MKMKIISMKPVNKGGLKATASVRIDNIIINEIKVTQSDRGLLVSMPTVVWIDNQQRYQTPAVELPDTLQEKIREFVLGVYNDRK